MIIFRFSRKWLILQLDLSIRGVLCITQIIYVNMKNGFLFYIKLLSWNMTTFGVKRVNRILSSSIVIFYS